MAQKGVPPYDKMVAFMDDQQTWYDVSSEAAKKVRDSYGKNLESPGDGTRTINNLLIVNNFTNNIEVSPAFGGLIKFPVARRPS